jgi:hypothetical protein
MIREFAIYQLGGMPMMVIFGFLTFLSFFITALIGYMNHRFKKESVVPFRWHPIMVVLSFTLASVHIVLVLSVFSQ